MQRVSSVAAGVVLGWNQNQARTGNRLWPRSSTEGVQNADDGCVRSQDADADRSGDSEAEDDGHKKRNHVQPPLTKRNIRCCSRWFRIPRILNLPALTLAASDD
jgi:hypothetical protein